MKPLEVMLVTLRDSRNGTRKFSEHDAVLGVGTFLAIDVVTQQAEDLGYVERKVHKSSRRVGVDWILVTITSQGRQYLGRKDFNQGAS